MAKLTSWHSSLVYVKQSHEETPIRSNDRCLFKPCKRRESKNNQSSSVFVSGHPTDDRFPLSANGRRSPLACTKMSLPSSPPSPSASHDLHEPEFVALIHLIPRFDQQRNVMVIDRPIYFIIHLYPLSASTLCRIHESPSTRQVDRHQWTQTMPNEASCALLGTVFLGGSHDTAQTTRFTRPISANESVGCASSHRFQLMFRPRPNLLYDDASHTHNPLRYDSDLYTSGVLCQPIHQCLPRISLHSLRALPTPSSPAGVLLVVYISFSR